ncbi:serine/threonine-protein kinase [Streptosporangium sp. NPDC002721]|uniref:serine/threonine-protein kinase n=1 Tax=Streptosporangium sp. NPDC002721 TaxID=3366188 RepID=UPI003696BA19
MSSSRHDGWLLAGRYRLVAGLGRGGTATVWRARDDLLHREVAVKEVAIPDHLAGPEREVLLERTMREARLAARLNHPNIAAVYDVVRADGRLWIVMQLVRSRDLAEVIAKEGPLPAPAVARVGLEVLSALEAAHAAGVMHRDVKPANILLTDDGHAILTDFGLATAVDEDVSLTRTGMVVGTPAYIAPERAGGVASSAESDLWSFGATLYAAAEGRSAFGRGTALATLAAVLTADPEPFRHAGPLAPVIAGLLDKDPARRTGAVRARRQLEEVATLWERGADSTVAPFPAARADSTVEPFPAARVAPSAADRSPTGPAGPTGADRRSTDHHLHAETGRHLMDHPHAVGGRRPTDQRLPEDADRRPTGEAGRASARRLITGRRRLSTGVAVLATGVLALATVVTVTAERGGGESGRSERGGPSAVAPVTTPQPTRTPGTRQVIDERRSTATPHHDERADAAPRAATSPTGTSTSGTAAKQANPNSNKDKTKDKGPKTTQRGNGKGNSKNH